MPAANLLQPFADVVFANAVQALPSKLLANAVTTGLPFPITGKPSIIQHAVDVTNHPANARYRYTLQIATSIVGPWTIEASFETMGRGTNLDGSPATESSGTWPCVLPAVCFGRVIVTQLAGQFFTTSATVRF